MPSLLSAEVFSIIMPSLILVTKMSVAPTPTNLLGNPKLLVILLTILLLAVIPMTLVTSPGKDP